MGEELYMLHAIHEGEHVVMTKGAEYKHVNHKASEGNIPYTGGNSKSRQNCEKAFFVKSDHAV